MTKKRSFVPVQGISLLISLGLVFVSSVLHAVTFKDGVLCRSGQALKRSVFYGSYMGSSVGPDAFDTIRTTAENEQQLLMVIYGRSDCTSNCDSFEQNWLANARTAPGYLTSLYCGYFRGGDAACVAAKAFLVSLGARDNCHIVGFYGKAQDGALFTKDNDKKPLVYTLPTTAAGLDKIIRNVRNLWLDFKKAHAYTAPDLSFAAGKTAGTQLQAKEDAQSVLVQINRIGNVEKEATISFVKSFPDGTVVTNEQKWAVGEVKKSENVDVAGKWVENGKVTLTLYDDAGKLIDTSYIHFVKATNSFSFPDMAFNEEGDWGQWTLDSEATWASVLAKVVAANTYTQVDTNDNPVFEQVVMDIPIFPSNRYETVYTNDIEFFAKEVVPFEHEFSGVVTNWTTTIYTNDVAAFEKAKDDEETDQVTVFAGELMIVTNYVAQMPDQGNEQAAKATKTLNVTNYVYGVENADDANPVEWTWARTTQEEQVECETNVIVNVVTEDADLVGTATTNYADLVCSAKGTKSYYVNQSVSKGKGYVPVEVSFASNCVYAVVPQTDLPPVTNLYSSVDAKYGNVVEVDDTITILPCDGDAEPSSVTVEMENDPSPVAWKFAQPDTCTYYTVASNWEETVEQPYACYGTNRTFYVELPGCVTNEDVSARGLVLQEGNWGTTNFYSVVLTNAEHEAAASDVTWTNFEVSVAVDCTNSYYTVGTNEYQYGEAGRESGGRDERGFQSFVLKVTGGVVWNGEVVAFASVLESKEFKDWCQSNKVATVLHECADPETGASLFSSAEAANGRSGVPFLSRNGLREEECEQPAASNVFEVALYRPDGTRAGVLAPQMKGGKCDLDENMTRLDELLMLADDLTEPANDDVATSTLKAYYGRTVLTEPAAELHALNVSDKKDVFELVEVPADEFVQISAISQPVSRYDGQEKPKVKVWRMSNGTASEIEPLWQDEGGSPVWRFSAADIAAGIYADVTAWTDEYAATGTFGGSVFRYPLTVTAAPEFPGVVSFPEHPGTVYDVDGDDTVRINLKVNRTGFTGAVTAKVSLVSSELPEGCLAWANADDATNLVWKAGEMGEKAIPLTIRNVLWEDSVSNMVFEVSEVTGAARDEKKYTCTIGIQQEDDENALTGRIYISSPEVAPGETVWKKSGVRVDVEVTRERVLNEASGNKEARGEASATIRVTGGATLSTNGVAWLSGSRTGGRVVRVIMPEVGSAGQQQVVFSVAGMDCDGKVISDSAASKIKFMVVDATAPEFSGGLNAEAYQYVPFEATVLLSDYDPGKMEIVEAVLYSGALPAGLSASPDTTAGGLKISGTPTGTNSTVATYQLTLRKSNGNLVKTMPVTVKIAGKALGGVAGDPSGAIIPGFAEKRVWQYLPMTSKENRLVGLLNLSVSTKGSVSARYTTPRRTIAFSAPAIEIVEKDEVSGGYRAKVMMEKAGHTLSVEFATNGEVSAKVVSEDEEAAFVSEANSVPWMSLKGGASAWKGRYVVAFLGTDGGEGDARGTAAIAINASSPAMAKSGRVTYSGVLPDGRSMNGTTAFVPAVQGTDTVKLPILWSSATDSFAAMLTATKSGGVVTLALDPDVTPSWNGGDGGTSVADGQFVAEDWSAAWKRDFGNAATTLRFKYNGKTGSATVAPDGMAIRVGSAGSVADDDFALESITLNRVSGVVTGTLKVSFGGQVATVNFRGCALPGDKKRFMAGSAWHLSEEDGVAVRKTVTVEIVPADAE